MSELSGLYALWYREFKVFTREKSRVVSSLITPLMWIVVFGGGLGASISLGGVGYQTFIFPGMIGLTILFTSVFFGIYIVWDKKIDFFKEVLVAPLSRTTIFTGKMLGGCTDATLQGLFLMAFGVFFGIGLTPLKVIQSILIMVLLAMGLVSIGLIIGSTMESFEGFNLITSFLTFPMFFFSGALFPIENLPSYLEVFTLIDPLTYGVDALRGIMLGTSRFPLLLDTALLGAFSASGILLGTLAFRRLK